MFGERRKHRRHTINRAGKLVMHSGGLPRDCLITDISESGARLFSEAPDVPDFFDLLISGESPIRQECQVVWRLGGEIGVTFNTGVRDAQRLNAMKALQSEARSIFRQSDST